jgi:ubiquinone/menaquinone biosynthesis C-methylase UbiE
MQKELFSQTWWDNNLNNSGKFNEYLGWLGNSDAESRIFIRENIKDLEIKSIADFGCGPCVEYIALSEEEYEFEYLGIDSCVHLKEYNESRGIPFVNVPVEKTGLEDSSYDLAYSRHVLEHLPTYKDALNEMIRVAKKYAVHIFFIKPTDEEKIIFDEPNNLYHNRYIKEEIETFLNENKKVESFEWIDINKKEVALSIEVK